MTESLSVVVVDDDPIVRQALMSLLVRVPGVAALSALSNGQEAVDHACATPADVYLIDVSMPVMDGVSTVLTLRSRGVRSRLVLLTSLSAEGMRTAATTAGADAFLVKTAPVQQIVSAVLGKAPAPQAPVAEGQETSSRQGEDALTQREAQVLQLLCRAWSNAEIARELCLAESTVKTHVGSLMVKLGVESRLQVVVKALRTGLAGD